MSDKTKASIDPRGAIIEAIDDMEVIQLTQVWQKLDIPAYCVAKIQNVSYGEGKRARLYVSKTPPFTLDDGFYLKPDNYFDLSTGDKSIYVRSDDGAKIGYMYTKVSIGSIEYKQDIEQFTEVIGTTPKEIVCDKGLYFIIQNIEPEDSDKMITFSVRTKNNLNDGFTLHATKFIGIPIMVDATIRIFAAEDTKITYVLMPPSSSNTGISKELEEKLNYYFGLINVINHTYVNKETLKGYLDTYWHEMQEYMSFNLALKVDKHEFYKFAQDVLMLFVEFSGSLQELDDRVERYKIELSTEDHRLDTVKFERKIPLHLWGGLRGNPDFMADRIDIKLDLDDYCFILPTKEIDDPDNPGQTITIEDEEGKLSLLKSSMPNKRDTDEGKLVTQGIALELDRDIQSRVKRSGDYFTDKVGMQKEQIFFNRENGSIKIMNPQIPIHDFTDKKCEIDFTNFHSIEKDNFVGNVLIEFTLMSSSIITRILIKFNLNSNDPKMGELLHMEILANLCKISSTYSSFYVISRNLNSEKGFHNVGFDRFGLYGRLKVKVESITYCDLDENTFNLISNVPNDWVLSVSSDNYQLIREEFLKPINFIDYSVLANNVSRVGGTSISNYGWPKLISSGAYDLEYFTSNISALDSHRLDNVDGEYYFNTLNHYYSDTIENLKVATDANGLTYTRPVTPGSLDDAHPIKKGVTAEFIKDILNTIIDNDGHRHSNVDYIHDSFMSKEDKLEFDLRKCFLELEQNVVFDLVGNLEDMKTPYNLFRYRNKYNNNEVIFMKVSDSELALLRGDSRIFLNSEIFIKSKNTLFNKSYQIPISDAFMSSRFLINKYAGWFESFYRIGFNENGEKLVIGMEKERYKGHTDSVDPTQYKGVIYEVIENGKIVTKRVLDENKIETTDGTNNYYLFEIPENNTTIFSPRLSSNNVWDTNTATPKINNIMTHYYEGITQYHRLIIGYGLDLDDENDIYIMTFGNNEYNKEFIVVGPGFGFYPESKAFNWAESYRSSYFDPANTKPHLESLSITYDKTLNAYVVNTYDYISDFKVYKLNLAKYVDKTKVSSFNDIKNKIIKIVTSEVGGVKLHGENRVPLLKSDYASYEVNENFNIDPSFFTPSKLDTDLSYKEFPVRNNNDILCFTKIDNFKELKKMDRYIFMTTSLDGSDRYIAIPQKIFLSKRAPLNVAVQGYTTKLDTRLVTSDEFDLIKKRYPNAYIDIFTGGDK